MTRLPAVCAALILLASTASAERWIIEVDPPGGDAPALDWAPAAAELLVRATLAELRDVELIGAADVKDDVATLGLARLASTTGDARMTLAKFARARCLVSLRLSAKPRLELSLTAINLSLAGREQTFTAPATADALAGSCAKLAEDAARFLGHNPSDAELARMKKVALIGRDVVSALGRGASTQTPAERLQHFRQASAVGAQTPLAWYVLAREQHAEAKLLEAISSYRRAILLDPDSPTFHFDLGNAFFDDKRPAEASTEYERAIALDPSRGEAWENLVRALGGQKLTPDDVVARVKKLAGEYAKTPVARAELGLALSNAGKLAEALVEFREAARLAPADAIAHFNVAHTLDRMKDTSGAIAEYKAALDLAPNYAKAWNNLGFLYEQAGKTELALYHYQQATKFAPGYALAWTNLGIAYEHRGDLLLAADAYRKVTQLEPKSAVAWFNLGTAYHRAGNVKGAIDAYKKSLELSPDDKLSHYNLAVAYERAGLWNLANKHWKRVLELGPTEDEKRTAERHLKENEGR